MKNNELITDESSVRLDFLEAGSFSCRPFGALSQKTVPYTIVCQVTRGKYKLTSGGQTIETQPPVAWITPANQELQAWHFGDPEYDDEMSVQYVHFNFVLYENLALTSLYDMPIKTSDAVGQKLTEPIGKLVELQKAPRTIESITQRQLLAWQVLDTVISISKPKPDMHQRLWVIDKLKPLLKYLQLHLSSPVTIGQMARLAHLSPSRFHTLFKQSMNMTPLEYVKKIRLNTAARMLLTLDMNVAEISRAVGFTNQFHMSREFSRSFGLSPLKYRKHKMNAPE